MEVSWYKHHFTWILQKQFFKKVDMKADSDV